MPKYKIWCESDVPCAQDPSLPIYIFAKKKVKQNSTSKEKYREILLENMRGKLCNGY